MELLHFTEQARCAIQALTKAIEGFCKAREPNIIEYKLDNYGKSGRVRMLSIRADMIVNISEDTNGKALLSDGPSEPYSIDMDYGEAVRIWKEGLKNG